MHIFFLHGGLQGSVYVKESRSAGWKQIIIIQISIPRAWLEFRDQFKFDRWSQILHCAMNDEAWIIILVCYWLFYEYFEPLFFHEFVFSMYFWKNCENIFEARYSLRFQRMIICKEIVEYRVVHKNSLCLSKCKIRWSSILHLNNIFFVFQAVESSLSMFLEPQGTIKWYAPGYKRYIYQHFQQNFTINWRNMHGSKLNLPCSFKTLTLTLTLVLYFSHVQYLNKSDQNFGFYGYSKLGRNKKHVTYHIISYHTTYYRNT